MFVIMGATGQVGGAALEALKQRGATVRAVSRDPARAGGLGVETVRGDASDTASLVSAFKGAEAVFVLLVPPALAEDVLAESRAAAQSIASAVREAKVPHIVALSSVGAHLGEGNGIVRALHDFETALAGAAPSIVFVRPGDFLENWAAVLPAVLEAGVLPSGKLPLEAHSDAVSALDVGRPGEPARQDLRSDADRQCPGTRAVFAARPAVPSSREETVAGLTAAGLGADYAEKLADLDEAFNAGRLAFPANSGELRRGTITLDTVLQRLLGGRR